MNVLKDPKGRDMKSLRLLWTLSPSCVGLFVGMSMAPFLHAFYNNATTTALELLTVFLGTLLEGAGRHMTAIYEYIMSHFSHRPKNGPNIIFVIPLVTAMVPIICLRRDLISGKTMNPTDLAFLTWSVASLCSSAIYRLGEHAKSRE